MKKFTLLAMFVAIVLSVSAQYKMRVWVNGGSVVYPVAIVDSVTFEGEDLPDDPSTPDVPSPDPNPDPSTAKGIGVFSVGEGKKVSFAPGNLQFNAVQGSHLRADGTTAKGTWRFAENQWDYVGDDNQYIAEDYDGWIDLFGWGTSGYDNTAKDPGAVNYHPWSSSTVQMNNILIDSTLNCDMFDIIGDCIWEYEYWYAQYNSDGYGPSTNMPSRDLTGSSRNYDWGEYNAISNGGNKAGLWRTLTREEWKYLLFSRKNAGYLSTSATVNGVYGCIIFPDDFKKPADISWTYNASDWTVNVFSEAQWLLLEDLGAVFLPAAGDRGSRDNGDVVGTYWSATSEEDSSSEAYYCLFYSWNWSIVCNYTYRLEASGGRSVRLVKDLRDSIVVSGYENNHAYVDLGLPSGLKWATCNLGANYPDEYGDYFAWGEVEPKTEYNWSTYKWCNGSSNTQTKYNTSDGYGTVDNKTQLELSDDAARANWGGNWRMPTKEEQDELRNNCTWTWATQNGVDGYKVTSKSNGNSIFLPAAGSRGDSSLNNAGSYGYYWSSSLSTSNTSDAYCLYFDSSYVDWYFYDRYYGRSVRPVCP